jgi:hypothetical protein
VEGVVDFSRAGVAGLWDLLIDEDEVIGEYI